MVQSHSMAIPSSNSSNEHEQRSIITQRRTLQWGTILSAQTFSFFVAMAMIVGVYGSRDLVLGPESSILVKVKNLESKPRTMLYGSYKYPPLDLAIPSNSHKEWIYYLNKGFEVNISYSLSSKSSSIFLVIAKDFEGLSEWLEHHPIYPNTTLSWKVIHRRGMIMSVALATLKNEEVKNTSNDEWYFVFPSYEDRLMTYITSLVGMCLIPMLWYMSLEYEHEDNRGGVRYEEELDNSSTSSSGSSSSYDSMSSLNEEDLDFTTIAGKCLWNDEAIDNDDNRNRLCAICYDAPRECFFLPCGHSVACFACGTRIEEGCGTCPVCRRKMKKVRKIFAV